MAGFWIYPGDGANMFTDDFNVENGRKRGLKGNAKVLAEQLEGWSCHY